MGEFITINGTIVKNSKDLLKNRTFIIHKINDNRSFWKTIVPPFLKKNPSKSEKITLTEEGKNVSDNAELCRVFNNYFSEIISN